MSTIVIVEDDRAIAAGLAMNLRYEGFEVVLAHDGETGLAKALETGVSLVLLDVMLPGMNGFEVLRELRARDPKRPVLLLTAKGAETDKVFGLNLGADDYVTKPFSLPEIVARIKALLRRAEPPSTTRMGDITIDFAAKTALRGKTAIELTAQEFRLLQVLVQNGERALAREQLLDLAWGVGYDGTERTVDTFIRQLRVKLERDPESPVHIQTVRGVGYRFVA